MGWFGDDSSQAQNYQDYQSSDNQASLSHEVIAGMSFAPLVVLLPQMLRDCPSWLDLAPFRRQARCPPVQPI